MNRQAHQAARLRTMRRLATGLLLLMVGIFVLAHARAGDHPAWGYLAAFAEAAMVGAIADWFAVVALFRHPLGIPIWHTAIIPTRKDEIARNLGEFVESHFVTIDTLVARIRGFDPAARLSAWLMQPHHAERVGDLLTAALRQILASVDDHRIKAWLRRTLTERLAAQDLSGPVANFGLELMAEKRHDALLDWALQRTHAWLDTEGAEATLGVALDSVLDNKFLALFKGSAATRIRAGLKALAEAALQDPQHPLRLRYENALAEWLEKLRSEPEFSQRLCDFQSGMLDSPRMQAVFEGLWDELRNWLDADLAHPDPTLRRHSSQMARQWAESLAGDAATRSWINESIVTAVQPLITDNRGKVAAFIAAQVDAWSKEEMTARMERALGRDLQFIRINGTLVGGLVGLTIHLVIDLMQRH
jgi:uncharacterized membrane-anchored protein YjiN (DUF445 family)